MNDKDYVWTRYKLLRMSEDDPKYSLFTEKMIQHNKELIKKYPFLLPHNRWTDEVPKDYDYTYTELDSMLGGWRMAFGIQMMDELKDELEKCNYLNDFRIMQIKEKYGTLRFYTGGVPRDSKVFEIIHKYEALSKETCENCGQKAEYVTNGWIGYFCKDCATEIGLDDFTKISDLEKENEEED